jgi:hypothetical protein
MNRALRPPPGQDVNCQRSDSLNRGKIMGILAFIQQKFEWVRELDTFGMFRRNRPAAPARFCEFGHTVFSGNNLCNYGHHAA